MSAATVEALARRNGPDSFWTEPKSQPFQPIEYHLSQGATAFHFWFFDNQLKIYQQIRRSGIEQLDVSDPVDLCTTHPVSVLDLTANVPPELAGTLVYVDGMLVGQMLDRKSGTASRSIELRLLGLASGEHELSFENGASVRTVRRFTYSPRTAWPYRESMQIDVPQGEVRGAA